MSSRSLVFSHFPLSTHDLAFAPIGAVLGTTPPLRVTLPATIIPLYPTMPPAHDPHFAPRPSHTSTYPIAERYLHYTHTESKTREKRRPKHLIVSRYLPCLYIELAIYRREGLVVYGPRLFPGYA